MRAPYVRPFFLAVILVLTGAGVLPSAAQPGPATTFSFLRLAPSARAASLAGAFSAVYDEDVNALFYNPALLNPDMHRTLSVTYLNHLGGIHAGFVSHARHREGIGTLGAGLRYVTWGSTEGYDAAGNATESFGANDVALTASWARAHDERLRYGANLHAAFSSVETASASAFAADAGVLYHVPEKQLALSASVHNIGIVADALGSSRDTLPLDLRVGVSKRFRYLPLLLSLSGYNLNRIGEESEGRNAASGVLRHVAVGWEFFFGDAFRLRMGYNHRQHQDLKMKNRLDMAGVGVGCGIRVASFRFDYAFNSWSTLGGLHQITVRTGI